VVILGLFKKYNVAGFPVMAGIARFGVLFILAALVLCPVRAEALDREIFTPTSAWLVGPATILPAGRDSFSMPCVMVNNFDNGYILRLSGGGGKIFAMAANFRQDAFEKGETYEVTVGITPDFSKTFPATAHDKETLLINLQKVDGVYAALREAQSLSLAIGSGKFEFAMPGVKDGLKRIEECYSPDGQRKAVSEPRQASASAAPRGPDDAVPPAYSEAVSDDGTEDAAVPQIPFAPPPRKVVSAKRVPAIAVEEEDLPQPSPSAGKKESEDLQARLVQLDSMIAAAAKKLAALEPAAGAAMPVPVPQPKIQPQIQAPPPPQTQLQVQPQAMPVAQTQVSQGHVPGQTIGRPLASTWMQPVVKKDGLVQREVTAATHPVVAAPALTRRWRAMKGNNIHEVFDVWATHENARLVWQADEEFSINQSVSMQGSFEEAVQTVLEQQNGEGKRPVGRIYVDPILHQKVLVVETVRDF